MFSLPPSTDTENQGSLNCDLGERSRSDLLGGKDRHIQLLCFLVVFPFYNSQQFPFEVNAVITHILVFSKVLVFFFLCFCNGSV